LYNRPMIEPTLQVFQCTSCGEPVTVFCKYCGRCSRCCKRLGRQGFHGQLGRALWRIRGSTEFGLKTTPLRDKSGSLLISLLIFTIFGPLPAYSLLAQGLISLGTAILILALVFSISTVLFYSLLRSQNRKSLDTVFSGERGLGKS